MTLVKVCGIRTLDEGRAALEAGADWLGFVFWGGSRRGIEPEAAGSIINKLRGRPEPWSAVGVFVDPTPAEVERAAHVAGIDRAQVCGDEDAATITAIALPTIKSIRIRRGEEARAAAIVDQEALAADLYLLDTHADGQYGGTGSSFDWDALRPVGSRCIVAGGLRPENVQLALQTLSPLGVDVSSGVERPGGGKDPALIRAFVEAVRTYDRLALAH
jgi:phosphoribosylanthranilate isomerase